LDIVHRTLKIPDIVSSKILFSFLTLSFFIFTSVFAQDVNEEQKKERVRLFIRHLSNENFLAATTMFDEKVVEKIGEEMLEKIWRGIEMQAGRFYVINSVKTLEQGQYLVIDATCEFEKMILDIRLSVNSQNKISGLFFLPSASDKPYNAPSYAKPKRIKETEIIVRTGKYEMPGILSRPAKGKKLPLIILVHGSGPQNKDVRIGPNRIFKDISLGLASNKIAVLRYDKRTYTYGREMAADSIKEVTVMEETIEDVLSAIELAKTFPGIDTNRIYIAGHSLGGMLAPRIAALNPQIKGIILLAANARPLEDLIVEQVMYLQENGKLDALISLDDILAQVKFLKEGKLTSETPSEKLPLGLPASYWLDIRLYDQMAVLKELKQPVLVLQGERDYQVSMKDFELWKSLEKKNLTAKSYPLLNHLLLEGIGASYPEEYFNEGKVPFYLIKDIIRWIRKN
jgi:uncharacterized protein